jgi:hypothetical protein
VRPCNESLRLCLLRPRLHRRWPSPSFSPASWAVAPGGRSQAMPDQIHAVRKTSCRCSWSVSHAPRRRCPPSPLQLWPRRSRLCRGRPCGIGRFNHRSQSSVGQYGHPLRVVAMNVEEGWCRDVSDVMADKVREVAQREDMELTDGTRWRSLAHEPQVKQAMLPLW